jgi:hypothetical protein
MQLRRSSYNLFWGYADERQTLQNSLYSQILWEKITIFIIKKVKKAARA